MFLITQIYRNSRVDQPRQSLGRYLTRRFEELGVRFRLYETVRRERASLARLSDEELRDIGLHRADAELESQRRYLDLPINRE